MQYPMTPLVAASAPRVYRGVGCRREFPSGTDTIIIIYFFILYNDNLTNIGLLLNSSKSQILLIHGRSTRGKANSSIYFQSAHSRWLQIDFGAITLEPLVTIADSFHKELYT